MQKSPHDEGFQVLSIYVDEYDVIRATVKDGVNLAFKSAGERYALEIEAVSKCIFTDGGNRRGDHNGFERSAVPECHRADLFNTFVEGEVLEVGATASAYVPYQKSVATYDYSTKTLNGGLQAFAPMTTITNGDGATMTVEYFKDFEVFNEGLELSRPLMVLRGRGTVEISVNGTGIFTYTFPEGENEVIIDSEKEDAYLGSVLKNRNMNGEFPILLPKTNKIGWSGDVESIEILPRSRWL